MARPSATSSSSSSSAAAARVLIGASVNVAFLLLLAFFFIISSRGGTPPGAVGIRGRRDGGGGGGGVLRVENYVERCKHVAEDDGLDRRRFPRGYVNYLYLFYCVFGEERRVLGYAVMAAWLAVLFYLLGDTAAVYFCSSLEGLSRLLRLSPAIAGVTLLSLGNGAPDALSTIASFASGGKGETTAVGLNGVLGSAMLVSSAVLGIIGVHLGARGVAIDRVNFYRDASFLLVALAAVAVVLAAGEVTIWGALSFTSLYVVYVVAVALTHGRTTSKGRDAEADHTADAFSDSELCNVAETKFYADQEPLLPETAPLLSYYAGDGNGDRGGGGSKKKIRSAFWSLLRALELPLWLPRRLTIPDASKERWSKPAAVTAVTLAPILLSHLCSHASGSNSPLAVLLGFLAGASLGVLAFFTTSPDAPPTDHLAAWLAGGFVMSVAWAYAVATELLALLVSAAHAMGVDSAALGLTVLAWGNSLGDLVANLAVASRGGGGGAQVAVAGCYGGPVFDMLVGLGVSMLLSSWAAHPQPVAMPAEAGPFQTLAFAAAGICWAVVVMSRRGMRVDRTLGFGLLAIYLCFLCINISEALGLV
uniref:Sodium/calcium exchanger membrane region domain-containing protein n=1 Tax=Oryza punctata TaxID=4537 RepID=A0A0E0M7Z6_ORYPU